MKTPLVFVIILFAVLGFASSYLLQQPPKMELQSLTWFGQQARPLPSFHLTDSNGQAYTESSIRGHWQLLYFGYTQCPDICPTTLQTLAQAWSMMDQATQQKLQVAFITVDPQRDDLLTLKSYVQYFNLHFLGVNGDMQNLNRLTDAVGIVHAIDRDGEHYDVSHSGALVLIDDEGRFSGVFSPPQQAGQIAHDLTTIINL